MTFYKELRKNPAGVETVLTYVTDLLTAYATRLLANGATAIAVGDPSATGEILGPKMFETYAVRFNNLFADRIHALGAPFILHICGEMKAVRHLLPQLRCDALSTDALVSLPRLKADYPSITTMGNVSTFALEWDDTDKIRTITRSLVDRGADITSGILATQLADLRGTTLFVDIGTNGEMVLATDGKLTATSTAAGPAFEGMSISCGMRAGIELMLAANGVAADRVDRVLIAGSFGFHLRTASLINLGLLPRAFHDRVAFVGNTSKSGARAFLLNRVLRETFQRLVRSVHVLELANDPAFEKTFVRALAF